MFSVKKTYRNTDELIVEKAYLIRAAETAFLELFKQGLLRGTVHTCVGQEFSALSVCNYLTDQDFVVSNHRGHGHFVAHTGDVKALIGELLGKEIGASKGIGGSQHLYHDNFISNGIQGSILPVAAGIAFAKKLKGENDIAVVFAGDGTLGEGAFYETLNLVSLYSLPLLIILEDNEISQSTPQSQNLSGTIKGRSEAFGISYYFGSTNDLDQLFETTSKAVNFVKTKSKPAFCHIKTNRLNAHSKGDDTRATSVVNALIDEDPLNKLLSTHDGCEIKKRVDPYIKSLVDNCLKEREAQGRCLTEYPCDDDLEFLEYNVFESEERMNARINTALRKCLSSNSKVMLLGEDIEAPYGGAFKITQGLSTEFPERVLNTPISELGITGLANGLSLAGFTPIVEIMFGDFSSLIVDQILNGSVKFREMFGGQIDCPIKIRTPMGAGGGYGPTHSQSIEKLFLTVDGLDVVALNRLIDPVLHYREVIRSNKPTFVVEHKSDYGKKFDLGDKHSINFYISNEKYPTILCQPKKRKPSITIFTYGANVQKALELQKIMFVKEEKFAQVVVFSKISNISAQILDITTRDVDEVIILEDGTPSHGWGSEIISSIVITSGRKFNFRRLGAKHHLIPASYHLEQKILLSVEDYRKYSNG